MNRSQLLENAQKFTLTVTVEEMKNKSLTLAVSSDSAQRDQ